MLLRPIGVSTRGKRIDLLKMHLRWPL